VPLLQQASWVNCLADFSELPPDLRTIILNHMGAILFQRWRESLLETRLQRAWLELNTEDSRSLAYRVIQ